MPIPTLRQRLPRRALTTIASAVCATTVLVGCGSHDSASNADRPSVPNLKLDGVQALNLDANESFGVMANGVYTVTGHEVTGVDIHTGQKLWQISSPTALDKDKTQVLDAGHVLMVGGKDQPGLTAYDTATGQVLWSTPAEQWFEADESTGQFVHNDSRTGTQRWSVDPGTLGCATPLSKDLPALFDLGVPSLVESPSVDVFRCASPNGRFVVGGLDRATGATVWHREVANKGSFLRGPGRIGTVRTGDTLETVDMATGKSLGSRKPVSDNELHIFLGDGSALTLDSDVIAEDKDMRLQEPDGKIRWTVPLDPKEESQPLMANSGNAVFTLVRQRADSSYKAWLIAYDAKDGKRTVVAGPGPTATGEKPTLTMNLGAVDTGLDSGPWGLLVAGPDNGYATIPVA
ncbi:PQQ-binding-like beta-propeller repeat protein [Nocardia sp. NPDC059240]|uniref:outer membrane protein assembly factor BamB family protein n=1 Tax=Nocardia sp. NPDC059240 TaxID=3346786 RepID=UPI00368F984D